MKYFFDTTNLNDNPKQNEEEEFNLDRALVRYEFLEILVRLAIFKFIEHGDLE